MRTNYVNFAQIFLGPVPVLCLGIHHIDCHKTEPSGEKNAMKTSLAHLPEQKQQALALLVDKLREAYPMGIRTIILFGSHARGTWVEEKAPDGVRYTYQSDFDVFIVTDTAQRGV